MAKEKKQYYGLGDYREFVPRENWSKDDVVDGKGFHYKKHTGKTVVFYDYTAKCKYRYDFDNQKVALINDRGEEYTNYSIDFETFFNRPSKILRVAKLAAIIENGLDEEVQDVTSVEEVASRVLVESRCHSLDEEVTYETVTNIILTEESLDEMSKERKEKLHKAAEKVADNAKKNWDDKKFIAAKKISHKYEENEESLDENKFNDPKDGEAANKAMTKAVMNDINGKEGHSTVVDKEKALKKLKRHDQSTGDDSHKSDKSRKKTIRKAIKAQYEEDMDEARAPEVDDTKAPNNRAKAALGGGAGQQSRQNSIKRSLVKRGVLNKNGTSKKTGYQDGCVFNKETGEIYSDRSKKKNEEEIDEGAFSEIDIAARERYHKSGESLSRKQLNREIKRYKGERSQLDKKSKNEEESFLEASPENGEVFESYVPVGGSKIEPKSRSCKICGATTDKGAWCDSCVKKHREEQAKKANEEELDESYLLQHFAREKQNEYRDKSKLNDPSESGGKLTNAGKLRLAHRIESTSQEIDRGKDEKERRKYVQKSISRHNKKNEDMDEDCICSSPNVVQATKVQQIKNKKVNEELSDEEYFHNKRLSILESMRSKASETVLNEENSSFVYKDESTDTGKMRRNRMSALSSMRTH